MKVEELKPLREKMWLLCGGCLVDINEIVCAVVHDAEKYIEIVLKGQDKYIHMPFNTQEQADEVLKAIFESAK